MWCWAQFNLVARSFAQSHPPTMNVSHSGFELRALFILRLIWTADFQKNNHNCFHQMSYFEAKMHKIWFLPQTILRELTVLSIDTYSI